MAFEGASSFSRSVRSNQPMPGWPITWEISRPWNVFPIPSGEATQVPYRGSAETGNGGATAAAPAEGWLAAGWVQKNKPKAKPNRTMELRTG